MPRQVSFDFVLETTNAPDKQEFIRTKLSAAIEQPGDELLRHVAGFTVSAVHD